MELVKESYSNGGSPLEMNAIFYSTIVLQVWAKTGTVEEGADKAKQLLGCNEKLYEQGREYAQIHGIMYNAVIDAIAHRQQPMEEFAEAGVYEVFPNVVAYDNCAMCAIADSDDPTAVDPALALLDRMEKLHQEGHRPVRPDSMTFSCVVAACLKRNGEKGTTMAYATIEKFFDLVKSSKQTRDELARMPCGMPSTHPETEPKNHLLTIVNVYYTPVTCPQ